MVRQYGDDYVKTMLLFLAEKISRNFCSIGFASNDKKIFSNNSDPDILKQMAKIFSKIVFLDDSTIAICDMQISEAKYYLNIIATFFFGKHGIIGPLSFVSGERDIGSNYLWNSIKIIKINKGNLNLRGFRIFFEKLSAGKWQAVEIRKFLEENCTAKDSVFGQLKNIIAQEA